VMTVEDARADPRFRESPFVTGPPGVRSCSCAPLKTPEGFRVGTLCAMDREAREFRPEEVRILERLAAVVMDELELRRETQETLEAVARQRQRPGMWAAAFDSAALGVTIVSEDGWFLEVNPAYCRMTGFAREELLGHHFTIVLPEETRHEARRMHAGFFTGEERGPIEWRLRRKDGSRIDVQLTGAPFVTEDGARFRVTTLTDITAAKRMEEQLRAAEKMGALSRLAGGAAHGFNNLLTIISGYSQLLRNSLSEGDPVSIYVDEIAVAAERAAALTNKLLAFSRRRFGAPERLDINELVSATAASVRAEMPPRIEVETSLAPQLPAVFADRTHLSQGIRDLVTNAREAMPQGGRLTIRTEAVELAAPESVIEGGLRPGSYVVVTVADTGEGIDPEARKHLFEPFFTTKGVGKGTGLATVYGTVKQFGGDVRVTSSPGEGTAVSLYLPAMK
jgi:PAS domain S-box-containing protein